MHQSAIVLVRCVPGSCRRHIGKREDPGDEVAFPPETPDTHCDTLLEPASGQEGIFVTKTQTKMATGWTQFQPWQNQPLPPGWEARYDANVRR